MYACMCIWCVFNCGFKLLLGSLIHKYMYGYTYMEVFNYGLALIRLYMHIYVCMGHIYFRVALIRKYIYMGVYIWKYLAYNLEPRCLFL